MNHYLKYYFVLKCKLIKFHKKIHAGLANNLAIYGSDFTLEIFGTFPWARLKYSDGSLVSTCLLLFWGGDEVGLILDLPT